MNRNQVFYISGTLILTLVIGGLYYLNTQSKGDCDQIENRYSIEIINCSSIAKSTTDLDNEMQAYLKSIKVNENVFFTPVLKINSQSFGIPIYGLNYMRFYFDADAYLYSDRDDDESFFFSNRNASDEAYISIKKSANSGSKISADLKNITSNRDAFIIYRGYQREHDVNKKVWQSMAALREHIKALFTEGVFKKNQEIKVYYFCGEGGFLDDDGDGVVNSKDKCPTIKGDQKHNGCPDSDKDGIFDDIDKCKTEKGDSRCDGCKCPPTPICPGDNDTDRDGVCDAKDRCPKEFGFAKYNGCPPPAKIVSPPNIKITHNNNDGTFTVLATNSDGSSPDLKAYLEITQRSGKMIKQDFSGPVSPTKDEANKLFNNISELANLTVIVIVKDMDGKELDRKTFNGLSMVCINTGLCGFKRL